MPQNSIGGGYDDLSIANFYDYVVPYTVRPDVGFYVKVAKEAGGPILEVGCGTGRVLIPTARVGIEIVGLDFSPRMLEVCKDRLSKEPSEVRSKVQLVQADMREFSLARTFNLATIPFRPFQHLLTMADQLACLNSIRSHLAEDGFLIFDIFNPSLESLTRGPMDMESEAEPEFTMPDGSRVVRRYKITAQDRFTQVIDCELIYYVTHPDGREERLVHAFPMRYLFRFEAEHLLARAGFRVERVYSGFDNGELGSVYPGELVFVARKTRQASPSGS